MRSLRIECEAQMDMGTLSRGRLAGAAPMLDERRFKLPRTTDLYCCRCLRQFKYVATSYRSKSNGRLDVGEELLTSSSQRPSDMSSNFSGDGVRQGAKVQLKTFAPVPVITLATWLFFAALTEWQVHTRDSTAKPGSLFSPAFS